MPPRSGAARSQLARSRCDSSEASPATCIFPREPKHERSPSGDKAESSCRPFSFIQEQSRSQISLAERRETIRRKLCPPRSIDPASASRWLVPSPQRYCCFACAETGECDAKPAASTRLKSKYVSPQSLAIWPERSGTAAASGDRKTLADDAGHKASQRMLLSSGGFHQCLYGRAGFRSQPLNLPRLLCVGASGGPRRGASLGSSAALSPILEYAFLGGRCRRPMPHQCTNSARFSIDLDMVGQIGGPP